MSQELQNEVNSAERRACDHTGRKLTEKRQRVLEVLLKAKAPLSAYEVTDAYNKVNQPPIMAMSIYRILEFLESVQLIHRLQSANKYVACSEVSECAHHPFSLFLLCQSCQQVEENSMPSNLVQQLTQNLMSSGFLMTDTQLEISGVCSRCQSETPQKNKETCSNATATN